MPEFQVGDLVRVRSGWRILGREVGEIGVIATNVQPWVTDDWAFTRVVFSDGHEQNFLIKHLEKADPCD